MQPDPYADLAPEERRLLAERALRYAKLDERRLEVVDEAVCFRRGEDRFALPLESLREIRALFALCRVPGASPIVPGVLHHRGEILSAHDLSAFLRGRAPAEEPSFAIVVDVGGRRIALLADELASVIPIAASALVALPATLGDRASCFLGVFDDSVLVTKPAELFQIPSLAHAF